MKMLHNAQERLWLSLVLALCVLAVSVSHARAVDRTVTIVVTVRDVDQSAIAGVAVEVEGESHEFYGTTDTAGTVAASVVVSDAEASLTVSLHPAYAPGTRRPSATEQARFDQVLTGRCHPTAMTVALQQGVSSYSATIQLVAAVSVRGHFVGSPLVKGDVVVEIVGTPWAAKIDWIARTFSFDGIAKGQAGEIAVVNVKTGGMMTVTYSAQQANSNVDLGDVAVPDGTSGVLVNITLSNTSAWGALGTPDYTSRSIVLMRDDGMLVRSYRVGAQGRVCSDMKGCGPLNVPPGTYFVCPGLSADSWPVKLIRAKFQQSGIAGLQAASIPSIVVTDNNSNTYTVDLAATLSACRALRSP